MGVFSDLLAGTPAFDVTNPITALDKIVHRELDEIIKQGDVAYGTETAVTNEVQSLSATAAISGNFTLAFTLASGETFTTGSLAFNAAASAIETAIDSAATTASVVGWTNGDISVSGGPANSGATVFTFDGASVAGLNHGVIVPADVDLSDSTPGVVSVTTEGQTARSAWAALIALGIAAPANVPVQGVAPTAFTAPSNPGNNAHYPSEATIRALASTAAIQDATVAVETEILAAAGLV